MSNWKEYSNQLQPIQSRIIDESRVELKADNEVITVTCKLDKAYKCMDALSCLDEMNWLIGLDFADMYKLLFGKGKELYYLGWPNIDRNYSKMSRDIYEFLIHYNLDEIGTFVWGTGNLSLMDCKEVSEALSMDKESVFCLQVPSDGRGDVSFYAIVVCDSRNTRT